MEFFEYPKRIDAEKVVNSREEEIEYLKSKEVKSDRDAFAKIADNIALEIGMKGFVNDKKDETGVSSEIGKREKSQQVESIGGASKEAVGGCGDVQTHEQGEKSPVGVLKRKPGRPKR